MIFSLIPPTGSTLPVRDSSPVMATCWRAGLRRAKDARAAAMVAPADGPSLGVAPSGTCKWMWLTNTYTHSCIYIGGWVAFFLNTTPAVRYTSFVAGDFTNIIDTYTNNTQAENNNLWIILSIISCGFWTHNTQHNEKRRGDTLDH